MEDCLPMRGEMALPCEITQEPGSPRRKGYATCSESRIRTEVLVFKTPNFASQLGVQAQTYRVRSHPARLSI
jgi:hypothetical protein